MVALMSGGGGLKERRESNDSLCSYALDFIKVWLLFYPWVCSINSYRVAFWSPPPPSLNLDHGGFLF